MKKRVLLVTSIVSLILGLGCLILGIVFLISNFENYLSFTFFGLGAAALICAIVLFILFFKTDANKISHNTIKRKKGTSPTCTIQISTEYMVKESYTKEQAEKTIAQLYSLHQNDGFSLEEYEKIKAKIISRIKDND